MCNRSNKNGFPVYPKDDREWKNLEIQASDVRWPNDTEAMWRFTQVIERGFDFFQVAPAQPRLPGFVVNHLLEVLRFCRREELNLHFRSDLAFSKTSSAPIAVISPAS